MNNFAIYILLAIALLSFALVYRKSKSSRDRKVIIITGILLISFFFLGSKGFLDHYLCLVFTFPLGMAWGCG